MLDPQARWFAERMLVWEGRRSKHFTYIRQLHLNSKETKACIIIVHFIALEEWTTFSLKQCDTSMLLQTGTLILMLFTVQHGPETIKCKRWSEPSKWWLLLILYIQYFTSKVRKFKARFFSPHSSVYSPAGSCKTSQSCANRTSNMPTPLSQLSARAQSPKQKK